MNSDLDVNLRDQPRASACARRGTLVLLQSHGPNKTRARRPHAPCPQVTTNLVPPRYRPEIGSAHESLARTTKRQRSTTSARRGVGSQRGDRVAAPPRMPPTLLSHDCFINYLIGITDCTKRCGTCTTETSLDLSDSGKRSLNRSWRAGRLPHQMLAHCWQTNSILSATPRYGTTFIPAHRCLALIRILPSAHLALAPSARTANAITPSEA